MIHERTLVKVGVTQHEQRGNLQGQSYHIGLIFSFTPTDLLTPPPGIMVPPNSMHQIDQEDPPDETHHGRKE